MRRGHEWDDVEVCSGFYQLGAASLPAWPCAFTWRNWVYLRDWSSSSGGAPLTCSLSMELKSSPGRLLVASDPVIGRWTPGRSIESSASNQHWAQLPVPHSLIWCSPPTHIYIRTNSELCLHLLWCLLYWSHETGWDERSQEVGMGIIFGLAQTGMHLKRSKGQSHGCIKPNAATDQSCLFCGRTAVPQTHMCFHQCASGCSFTATLQSARANVVVNAS